MFATIQHYCDDLFSDFTAIPAGRKELLEKISSYVKTKHQENKPAHLVYICTHNSRRSIFGQVWAIVAAEYFGVKLVETFSGGAEATAFNANAIEALKRAGFKIQAESEDTNPLYKVLYNDHKKPISCFSKVFDHPSNPSREFAAIMTCGEAEKNCPFIPGAELRIATTYEDPKAYDGTPLQEKKYDDRCRQIAREAFYLFSVVNSAK